MGPVAWCLHVTPVNSDRADSAAVAVTCLDTAVLASASAQDLLSHGLAGTPLPTVQHGMGTGSGLPSARPSSLLAPTEPQAGEGAATGPVRRTVSCLGGWPQGKPVEGSISLTWASVK